MSGEFVHQAFPRGPLLGAAALVMFALIAAGATSIRSGATIDGVSTEPVAVVALRFEDRADGGILVLDNRNDGAVETIDPGTGGFVRATLRALSRERKLNALGPGQPFELRQYPNGRLELHDLATGRTVYLSAFGPTNAGAFAALFDAAQRLQ
jgi:putative photosynthetic complex assembly protein